MSLRPANLIRIMPAEESQQTNTKNPPPAKEEGILLSTIERAFIFANGRIDDYDAIRNLITGDDLIIAADGGARHCSVLGLTPDYLIGDFDSLPQAEQSLFTGTSTQIIRHPARKDYTDLELSLLHAKSIGATRILVLGGLGARWDQTLANLLLPASKDLNQINIRFVDGEQELSMLHNGEQFDVKGNPGDIVSLIPISDHVDGVSTEGLEYPIDDETLHLGATRSISNSLIGNSGSVRVKRGSLLCVIIHETENG